MSENQIYRKVSAFIGSAGRQGGIRRRLTWLKRDSTVRLGEYATRFILPFILSRASILGGLSPFSVGLVASAPMGVAGALTALGAVLGYFLTGGFLWALKYAAICLLVYAASLVFRGTGVSKKAWFGPASASFMAACVGFVYASDAGWTLSAASLYITETALAGAMAYFYKIALSPYSASRPGSASELKHSISVLILFLTVLTAGSSIHIFEFISIGRIFSVILVAFAAFKGGAAMGCACGLAVGAAMDASLAQFPFFSFVYAISGLMSGLFSKQGRLFFLLSFILANAASVFWAWGAGVGLSVLYEVFIGSVIFMILPNSVIARLGVFFPGKSAGYGVLKAREYAKNRVDKTALAFSRLYEMVKDTAGVNYNDNETASLFDQAADAVCRKCSRQSLCWQENYQDTLTVMNDITPKMLSAGSITPEDFPSRFALGCKNITALTAAINEELRVLLYRRKYRNRLRDNLDVAYNQYSDIASVLKDLSSELGEEIGFDPELERKLQKYLRSLNMEAASAVFRDRGKRLHAEITSGDLYILKSDSAWLDKLSAVMGVRLCTSEEQRESDRLVLLEAEPLSATVGVASLRKRGQKLSGDKGTYFKTDEGKLYVLLSDGMGSGGAAAKNSDSAVNILESFLVAGVSPETSLRILNDLMLLKNETDTESATIDLMCIDLFSGESRIFKYGAAPSYIRRGSVVRSVRSKTLSPGLAPVSDSAPEYTKMKLDPSSVAVIASDGITCGEDDTWLRELIARYENKSAKDLARTIVETAARKFGGEDDMTVLTVFTETRK